MDVGPLPCLPLVARAQAGDAAALNTLLDRVQPLLRAFVSHRAGQQVKVEDLLQESLLHVSQRLGQFVDRDGSESAFRAWVLRLTANVIADMGRHERRQKRVRTSERRIPTASEAQASQMLAAMRRETGPVTGLLTQEQSDRVRAAMTHLPERQRAVVQLRALDGLSYAEIAAQLGMDDTGAEATVRALYSRAVAGLARHLGDESEA